MSSKRGRKRNDNLPPNRARDVQRAFRARRAAHLQALEQRVAELEEENGFLRHKMGMPANEWPPLGKGPTGKDNSKISDGISRLGLHSSRESSFVESPASRSSSLPPEHSTAVISRPIQVIEGNAWDNTPLINDQHQPEVCGKYELMHMPAPSPGAKPIQFLYNLPSTSRHSLQNNLFDNTPNSFSHPFDKSLPNNYNSQAFTAQSNMCDDLSGQPYPFSQTSFQGHDVNMHNQSPSPNGHHIHPRSRKETMQRDSPVSYLPHRRCATEPQVFGQGFPQVPSMPESQPNVQHNDFINPQNGTRQLPALPGAVYGPEGHLNHA